MTPEAADFLTNAQRPASEAEALLQSSFVEAAARTAYLAGFHAAQALIFDRTSRVLKTHNGVHAEFARLVRDHGSFGPALRGFLSRAYEFKAVADYGVGDKMRGTPDEARDAIGDATRLVALVGAKLAAPPM